MKIEIKEETWYSTVFKEVRTFYCVYVDDKYKNLCLTMEDAMQCIQAIKENSAVPKSKTVYTEII
jgi:hypothetical protein